MINEIIDYTQNLGSSEDVITALLATSIAYCPSFMYSLLEKTGIKCLQKDKNKYPYCIDTGFVISSSMYKWIGKVHNSTKLNFRPDIMISKVDEWNDDIPKDEEIILIESKIWAKLGDNQADNYKTFKEICNKVNIKNVSTVLISLDGIGNDEIENNFDISTTWNHVIRFAREAIKELEIPVEEAFLQEIFDLIEIRLIPNKKDFFDGDKIDCKKVLQKVKYRIANYSSKRASKAKQIDFYYNDFELDNDNQELIDRYGLNNRCQMSYLAFKNKNCTININCSMSSNGKIVFWHKNVDALTEGCSRYEFISEIDLSKPYWKYSWSDTLYKITQKISVASEGKK